MAETTLNLLMHEIKRERQCSRQHAYRLAHAVLEGLTELDATERRSNRKVRDHVQWEDFLQGHVLWED